MIALGGTDFARGGAFLVGLTTLKALEALEILGWCACVALEACGALLVALVPTAMVCNDVCVNRIKDGMK